MKLKLYAQGTDPAEVINALVNMETVTLRASGPEDRSLTVRKSTNKHFLSSTFTLTIDPNHGRCNMTTPVEVKELHWQGAVLTLEFEYTGLKKTPEDSGSIDDWFSIGTNNFADGLQVTLDIE